MSPYLDLPTLRRKYGKQLCALAKEHGLSNVRVFGSIARGEAGPDSDVDLLVHVDEYKNWSYIGFGVEARDLLGQKVDVVPDTHIHRLIEDRVLNEAVPVDEG